MRSTLDAIVAVPFDFIDMDDQPDYYETGNPNDRDIATPLDGTSPKLQELLVSDSRSPVADGNYLHLHRYLERTGVKTSPVCPQSSEAQAGVGAFTQMHVNHIALGHTSSPIKMIVNDRVTWARCGSYLSNYGPWVGQVCDVMTLVSGQIDDLANRRAHWAGDGIENSATECTADCEEGEHAHPAPISVGSLATVAQLGKDPVASLMGHRSSRIAVPPSQVQHGVAGTLCDNRVVHMTPGVPRTELTSADVLFHPGYKGIFCPVYTSLGSSSGCTRVLLEKVRIRVMGKEATEFLCNLSTADVSHNCYKCGDDGSCRRLDMLVCGVQHIACQCMRAASLDVYRRSHCDSEHTPTLHMYGTDRLVVSVNTGALMVYREGLGYLDSIMADRRAEQVWTHSNVPPQRVLDDLDLMSISSRVAPYCNLMSGARSALSSHFFAHAVCSPCNTVSNRTSPLYSEVPLVMSREGLQMYGPECKGFPGLNVSVAFAQLTLCYEDGFMMGESTAARFRYTKRIRW